MTGSDDKRLANLARLRGDLSLFSDECLKIKAKSGKIIPLTFNRAQRYFHERCEDQKRRTGMVRKLLGKGRQTGFSTYIGARFYHHTSLNRGIETFILTHEQDATDTLFGMVDRFHEHNPIRPSTGASNAKELRFSRLDSGYSVGTAGAKAAGRSKTIQRFHGSEVAFWPNAAGHFAGVMQAIPREAGTEAILESTGSAGTEFHARWQDAEAGRGDYEAEFIPWFWSDEYRANVPYDFALDAEEQEYAEQFSLDLEQMAWRRAKLTELKDPGLFKQEYPATASEMFQFTGKESFIKPGDMLRARKATHDEYGPLVIGADPARFGDDRFSLAWRRGRKVRKIESRQKVDTVAGANWIRQVIDADNPARVFVDAGGVGAGTIDILHSWGKPYDKIVVEINFGGSPQDEEIYMENGERRPGPRNRRSEMWSRSRDWLCAPGGADVPDSDALQTDACAPGYSYDMEQRLILESKERMRARGIRSPDEWDAVALTFAEPVKDAPPRGERPPRTPAGSGSSAAWMGA